MEPIFPFKIYHSVRTRSLVSTSINSIRSVIRSHRRADHRDLAFEINHLQAQLFAALLDYRHVIPHFAGGIERSSVFFDIFARKLPMQSHERGFARTPLSDEKHMLQRLSFVYEARKRPEYMIVFFADYNPSPYPDLSEVARSPALSPPFSNRSSNPLILFQ